MSLRLGELVVVDITENSKGILSLYIGKHKISLEICNRERLQNSYKSSLFSGRKIVIPFLKETLRVFENVTGILKKCLYGFHPFLTGKIRHKNGERIENILLERNLYTSDFLRIEVFDTDPYKVHFGNRHPLTLGNNRLIDFKVCFGSVKEFDYLLRKEILILLCLFGVLYRFLWKPSFCYFSTEKILDSVCREVMKHLMETEHSFIHSDNKCRKIRIHRFRFYIRNRLFNDPENLHRFISPGDPDDIGWFEGQAIGGSDVFIHCYCTR